MLFRCLKSYFGYHTWIENYWKTAKNKKTIDCFFPPKYNKIVLLLLEVLKKKKKITILYLLRFRLAVIKQLPTYESLYSVIRVGRVNCSLTSTIEYIDLKFCMNNLEWITFNLIRICRTLWFLPSPVRQFYWLRLSTIIGRSIPD